MSTSWSVLPDDYLKNLGEMISVHSFVEMAVYKLFMDCCGLDEDSAKVVIEHGSLKPTHMKAIITKLLELKPTDDLAADEALKGALSDYARLTEQRNKFAHWQWGHSTKGPSIINFLKQRPGSLPISQTISADEIRQVIEGLRSVALQLILNSPSVRNTLPAQVQSLMQQQR